MIYIAIILSLIAAIFLLSCCGKSKAVDTSVQDKVIKMDSLISDFINDTIKPLYSKKQIELKLKKLANTPPPTDLAMGAMCYSPSMIDTSSVSYICPICGEKTIYKFGVYSYSFNDDLEYGISAARREVSKIRGVNIKLDETQFCSHCRIVDIDQPQLGVWINIAGERDTNKIYGITYRDLKLLTEFFDDKLKYTDDYDYEYPLVERLDRLEELLGIRIDK
ncbi:MAG TPA: hypothetical protein PKN32_10185 [Bacteroidales bacterium]|nr:hypothetical protein [Bacteroidales bacterium]